MLDLNLERAFILGLFLISLFIIFPFLKYVLFSFVFYAVTYPIYKRINKFIKYPKISAVVSIMIIFTLLVVPLAVVLYGVYLEILKNLPDILKIINKINIPEGYKGYISYILPDIYRFVYNIVQTIPIQLIGILISSFITYYLLIETKSIKKYVDSILYFVDRGMLISKTKNIIYGSLVGNVAFWFIQSLLSYIAFLALSIPFSLSLTILVFIFACLPVLGPWAVWIPVIYWLFIQGRVVEAIFSFIYGIIFVTILSEIIIKPHLVSKFTEIHSVLVLLGIFGGLYTLGFVGIFLGPLILALFIEYIKLFIENNRLQ